MAKSKSDEMLAPDLFREHMECQAALATAMTEADEAKAKLVKALSEREQAIAIQHRGKVYRVCLIHDGETLTIDEMPFYSEKD